MAITAGPNASTTSGCGGPTSRRRTRSAGVRDNCSSGGSANPPSTAMAVRKPMPSGASPGARQIAAQQPRERLHEPGLCAEAQQRTEHGGQQSHDRELHQAHRRA